jgi:hypothetical protein
MGGEAASFAGMYSYIEMYDGTPEFHPETGPDNAAAPAVDGGDDTPQAIAASETTRNAVFRDMGPPLDASTLRAQREHAWPVGKSAVVTAG